MSFRNTLDDIQSNTTNITSNDTELGLLQTTTDSTGTLADLIGNIPAASFPAAVQNANTDVSFSGDHMRYDDRAAFDADTTTMWHVGDTATISMAIYFYIGTDDATNSGAMFLEDNFLELNGITTVALNDVTDVTISSAMDNQVLTYDSASMRWTNQGLPAGATITTSSEAYTAATTTPGMSVAATYNAGAFMAQENGGGTGTAGTIASQHTLYYNGLALIQGLDYTVASDRSSITVNATSQGEFEAGSNLILVNVVVSSS